MLLSGGLFFSVCTLPTTFCSVSCWHHHVPFVSGLEMTISMFKFQPKLPWLWGEHFGDPGGLRGGCAELQVLVEVTVSWGKEVVLVWEILSRPLLLKLSFWFFCISPPSFSTGLCTLCLWSSDSWILIFSGIFYPLLAGTEAMYNFPLIVCVPQKWLFLSLENPFSEPLQSAALLPLPQGNLQIPFCALCLQQKTSGQCVLWLSASVWPSVFVFSLCQ